jgi:divalent metal cation (Fe/Co/Zn/Cd) transporter
VATEGEPAESLGTVVVGGPADLAIAVAKAVAGVLSGSAAMLPEAAHPVADARHPFGYGEESYGWAFPAAPFVAGAVLAPTRRRAGRPS